MMIVIRVLFVAGARSGVLAQFSAVCDCAGCFVSKP